MNKTEEISRIAAEWWGNAVCRPKFDNGDPNGIVMAMATMCAKPVNYLSKELFIKSLVKSIVKGLEGESEEREVMLSVDYGPCRLLTEAAMDSDIGRNNFPWKTHMRISKHHVEVSHGYGAPMEYLYIDNTYCEQRIEGEKRAILFCQDAENFSYYDNEKNKLESMKNCELDARKQLEFYENKKKELDNRTDAK